GDGRSLELVPWLFRGIGMGRLCRQSNLGEGRSLKLVPWGGSAARQSPLGKAILRKINNHCFNNFSQPKNR
ncbi:MAG: hypothetical protein EA366_00190, partial [Spirulina sp. DLM2.Bin59]